MNPTEGRAERWAVSRQKKEKVRKAPMEVRRLLLKQNGVGSICVSKCEEESKVNFKRYSKESNLG